MAPLMPIRRAPIYEEVVERLRQLIEIEGLVPGDRLPPERELAGRIGVSRTSVRQAVTALRVMGVVAVKHGDGVYLLRSPADVIPPLDPKLLDEHPEITAVSDVREALESQAARLAARRRTPDDLARLKSALADMRQQVGRGDTGHTGDRKFHAAVVSASHSPLLSRLLGQLIDSVDTISEASLVRPGQPQRSLATHAEIVDAIDREDEEAAYQLMLGHLVITGALRDAAAEAQLDVSRDGAARSDHVPRRGVPGVM